jgi:hypothetical protein
VPKAPAKGLTEQNEIYRRTNMATGFEELFYVDAGGVEHAVGGTAGGGNHAITHADGGADELVEGSFAPSTQAFGDVASVGADTAKAAPRLHLHGMMADPVPAHVAAGDPHTQYATNTEFDDHNARHEPGGADPMAVDAAAAVGSLRTIGAGALQAAAGNDARLSDSRTALAHAIDGALHTLAGSTAGFVLRAINATSFAMARLAHSDLTIDSSHTHASTTGQTATDHHAAPVAGPDADITIDAAGAAGTAGAFARSAHGHKVSTSAVAALVLGTAAAGTSGHAPSRDDHVHPHGTGTVATAHAHADLSAVTADQHHTQTHASSHVLAGADRLAQDEVLAQAAPAQAIGAADTYVTSSAIAVPVATLRAGTIFRWRIFVSKTAAGVAAPIFIVRFGTAGAIGDTARVTITGQAQTAVVDQGCFDIDAIVTTIGATGNVLGCIVLNHRLGITGLAIGGWGETPVASANFDLTVANTKAGISVNPGLAAAWTVNRIITEIMNP